MQLFAKRAVELNTGANPTGGGGGGGGAGGYGLVVNKPTSVVNEAGWTISGGKGGNGGTGGNSTRRGASGDGGDGGGGGIGIWLNSNNISVLNQGSVRGADGGAAGSSGKSTRPANPNNTFYDQGGNPGVGGTGVYGTGTVGTELTNTAQAVITGGKGGTSISQSESMFSRMNASGGDGGVGVYNVLTIVNSGAITGGDGSSASIGGTYVTVADPGAVNYFRGSNGGNGGAGVTVTIGGSINNSGIVTGGNGAAGGNVSATYSEKSSNGGQEVMVSWHLQVQPLSIPARYRAALEQLVQPQPVRMSQMVMVGMVAMAFKVPD